MIKRYRQLYSSNCTIIMYNNIKTCCKPPTCFGLFRPSLESYSKKYVYKKIIIMAIHVVDGQ